MKYFRGLLSPIFVLSLSCVWISAQTSSAEQATVVPRLLSYSGRVLDAQGKAVAGIAGVTFAIYKDQYPGTAPLWLETQNVTADDQGNYTAQLGATKPQGLPLDLFATGEARWLGVQVSGEAEAPRVLLVAVPYALKAADAETVGGLPPSAFVLAAPAIPAATSNPTNVPSSDQVPPPASVTGSGTADYVPLWTSTSALGNSVLFQSGTGSTAKMGIGTTTPAATLDIKGTELVRGSLSLPTVSTATASAGSNSQPLNVVGSSYSSSSNAAVSQTFRWQVEPAGNNTATPSGTWNLLYGAGSAKPAETGLKIASNGLVTFATGQTFPGTGRGNGSVTSVGLSAPASDFTVSGSPVTSTGTLNLAWNVAPTDAATPNAIVKRDAYGDFEGGNIGVQYISAAQMEIYDNDTTSGQQAFNSVITAAGSTAIAGYTTATTGVGVNGTLFGASSTGQNGDFSAGVWGDSGSGEGLLGTADNSNALVAANNSPAGYTTAYFTNASTDSAAYVLYTNGTDFGGTCGVTVKGNLSCTGTVSAAVALDGGTRKVAVAAIESPQNWFEDFGSAQLVNGAAVVQLDPDFTQTVNAELDYKVFPVPNGDCKGLYVTNKTAASFEVRELGGGTSNVSFDYRITALRRNYENVRFADHTNDPMPYKAPLALATKAPDGPHLPPRPARVAHKPPIVSTITK